GGVLDQFEPGLPQRGTRAEPAPPAVINIFHGRVRSSEKTPPDSPARSLWKGTNRRLAARSCPGKARTDHAGLAFAIEAARGNSVYRSSGFLDHRGFATTPTT